LNTSETFNLNRKMLISQIKQKLPDYMVPTVYKIFHGFPKTINGKTDKNKLTIDQNDLIIMDNQKSGTLSPTENIIFNLWVEALKTTDISVNDNFFDIGGNSLMAISVFSKIESAFKIKLSLRVFFDSPRIKDLGELIDIAKQKMVYYKPDKKDKILSKIVKGEI